MRVEAIHTPCDPAELGRALYLASLSLLNAPLTRPAVDLLLAQWGLETGRGRACFNHNLGNVKSAPAWQGDHCERYCNELLTEQQARDAHSRATLTPDGTLDVILGGVVGGKRIVNFYPPNPATRFRAFDSLEAGALDYLSILADRFASAWRYLEAGDAAGFAAALHRARYYTADPKAYAAGLVSLQREYSHLTIDLSPPARDTLDGLTATQSDALRDLSWALLKESD